LAGFTEKFGTTVKTVSVWSGIGVAGTYLVGLSAGCVFLVVALLTAHQFQHAIRSAELEGKPVALWQVIELRDNWRVLQLRAAEAAKALGDAQMDLSAKESNLQEANAESANELAAIQTTQAAVVDKLVELGATAEEVAPLLRRSFTEALAGYRDLRKKLGATGVPADPLIEDFQKAILTYLTIGGRQTSAQEQVAQARAKIALFQEETVRARAQFATLLGKADEGEKRALLGNFLSQLNALDNSWFGALGSFAAMEPDLLTLLLVLAMGTLGGTIHLARLYLDGEKKAAGYFLYRPFLGAIAAVVIFVVARTGVFIIAEPSQQDNGTPLSPFFISFVAIVSGLMAEQAIASIQGTGEKWFSAPLRDKPSRYALWVADEIKKQKRQEGELKELLDMNDPDYAGWIGGTKPVPHRVQELIAAWVGKPVRELFSDIPPKRPSK
jgi:hypothetical protein